MQSLKEFSIYTKSAIGTRDTYALRESAAALGITKNMLAENAGANIAAELLHKHKNDSILVVAGSGNKGAIGLSVARHLMAYVKHIDVAMLCKPEEIKESVLKTNYSILSKLMDIHAIDDEKKLKALVKKADVVVDAIIGVGLKGRPNQCVSSAINIINKYSRHTVSIDIPSGIDPDTGLPNIASIKAHVLYVLYKNKPFTITRAYAQNVYIIDVGLPFSSELLAGPGDIMLATEPRLLTANKYTNGSVLVVGGSVAYAGAPLLAAYGTANALSALYGGAGYATVAMPSSLVARANAPPNIIVRGFEGDVLSKKDILKLGEVRHDVIVIGPGLSNDNESIGSIIELAKSESERGRGVILDATAIKAFAGSKSSLLKNM
ncbi:MAG: NAD(P)H-hydrate epimerase, partial [Candidatus Micrarchaeaceae archaeon]